MDASNAIPLHEAQIHLLFEEAGLMETPAPDMRRVDEVIERTMHEKAIKDTASFVFLGFPAALTGLMAVATNSVGEPDTDYRA